MHEPHTVWLQRRESGREGETGFSSTTQPLNSVLLMIKVERERIPTHADHALSGVMILQTVFFPKVPRWLLIGPCAQISSKEYMISSFKGP